MKTVASPRTNPNEKFEPYIAIGQWSHENARKQEQLRSEKRFAQREWPEEALFKNLEIPL